MGTLHSRPDIVARVNLYVSDQPDPSGFGEGASVLLPQPGIIQVVTDANGDGAFTVYFTERDGPLRHRFVTAIASLPDGGTEFSRAVEVIDDEPGFAVTTTADSGEGS